MKRFFHFAFCLILSICFIHSEESPQQSNKQLRDKHLKLYIEALSQLKQRSKMDQTLLREIKKESRLKSLIMLTHMATSNGFLTTSEEGYKKLLELSPDNPTFIREMAIISIRKNHFSKAAAYLEDFHSKAPGDLESHYFHAEALYWLKHYDHARKHFTKALKISRRQILPTIEHQMLRPRILTRLTYHDLALRKMRLLYGKNIDNPYVVLLNIDLLIQNDQTGKAKEIYQKFMKTVKMDDFEDETKLLLTMTNPRILNANLQTARAQELTEAMLIDKPESIPLLSLKAGIKNNLRHWRREKQVLKELKEIRPADEDIIRRYNFVERTHRSFVDIETFWRGTDDNTSQLITRLQAEKRFSDLWAIGLISELNFANTPEVFDENGLIDDLNGHEWVNELYSSWDFLNGGKLKLSLFLQSETQVVEDSGLGFWHKIALPNGDLQYGVDFRKPYWLITDGILLGLVRDRVYLGRSWQLSNKLQLSVTAGLNQYGLRHVYDTGQSTSITTNLSYRLSPAHWQYKLFGDASTIYLSYLIDYENFLSVENRRNIQGNIYTPIDHSDREVHTISALLFKEFCRHDSLETYLGYSYDRQSFEHGPIFGWLWRHRTDEHFEIRIYGSHSLTTATFTSLGVGIRWDF